MEKLYETVNEETRDIYLRKLLTGVYFGPLTNYPSIDKPWLKFYTEEQIQEEAIKGSLYDALVHYNRFNLMTTAINYYDNKISYLEMIKKIDETAIAFSNNGIKKGDKVTIAMPYLPETIYSIYALSKIGAIANVIDPRTNAETLKKYINEADSKMIIMIDRIEDKIASIKDETTLTKFISVSPLLSANTKAMKLLNKYNNIFKPNKYGFTKWQDFYKDYYIEPIDSRVKYEKDMPSVIVYTSGTSGNPKGAILTNDNFNNLALFQKQSVPDAKIGDKFLLIMPPFIAYGLVIGLHNQLCQGQELIMIPTFTLDKAKDMLAKLIIKHKPSYIMGVPNFVNIMRNDKRLKNYNLSFLKGFIVGGDMMNPNDEIKGNEWLHAHSANCNITKGWGMTEGSSCITYPKSSECNEIGSVGIPLSKNNIKILNTENIENIDINATELMYNQTGEIFATSPTVMKGYFNRPEYEKEVIFYDNQGQKWIKTGDKGHIDQNGILFFEDREKRLVVRPDGHNVSPSQIENVIMQHPAVISCVVVGIPSEKHASGSWPLACIELKEEYLNNKEQILKEIDDLCIKKIPPRDKANYYEFVSEVLYTNNGKVDYRKMQEKQKTLKKARKFYN